MRLELSNKGNRLGWFYPVKNEDKAIFMHCTGGMACCSKEDLKGLRLVFENHGIELEVDLDSCENCNPRCAEHYGDPG